MNNQTGSNNTNIGGTQNIDASSTNIKDNRREDHRKYTKISVSIVVVIVFAYLLISFNPFQSPQDKILGTWEVVAVKDSNGRSADLSSFEGLSFVFTDDGMYYIGNRDMGKYSFTDRQLVLTGFSLFSTCDYKFFGNSLTLGLTEGSVSMEVVLKKS